MCHDFFDKKISTADSIMTGSISTQFLTFPTVILNLLCPAGQLWIMANLVTCQCLRQFTPSHTNRNSHHKASMVSPIIPSSSLLISFGTFVSYFSFGSKLVEMGSQLTQPVWFNHRDVPHVILICLDNIIKHHPFGWVSECEYRCWVDVKFVVISYCPIHPSVVQIRSVGKKSPRLYSV